MEYIDQESLFDIENDMSVLNYLAQQVQGLQMVSGSFEELGVEVDEHAA